MSECESQIDKHFASFMQKEKRTKKANFVSFGDSQSLSVLINQNSNRLPKISFGVQKRRESKATEQSQREEDLESFEKEKYNTKDLFRDSDYSPERDTVKHSNSFKEHLEDSQKGSSKLFNLKIINNIEDEIQKEIRQETGNKKTLERFKNKKKQDDEEKNQENILKKDDFMYPETSKNKKEFFKKGSNSVSKIGKSSAKRIHEKRGTLRKAEIKKLNISKGNNTIFWNKKDSIKRKNIKSNNLIKLKRKESKEKKRNTSKKNSQNLGWTYSTIFNKSENLSNPNSKSVSSGNNSDMINPIFYQRIKSNFQVKKTDRNKSKANLSSFSEKYRSARSLGLDSEVSPEKSTGSRREGQGKSMANRLKGYFKLGTQRSKKNSNFLEKVYNKSSLVKKSKI